MGNSSAKHQYDEGYAGYGRYPTPSGYPPHRPPYLDQRNSLPNGSGYQHLAGGHRSRAAQQRSKSTTEHYEVLSRAVDTESPARDDYQYNGYERLGYGNGQHPPRPGMVYHPPRVEPRPVETMEDPGPQPVYINPQPYQTPQVYPPHPAELSRVHQLPPRAGPGMYPPGLAQPQYLSAEQQPQYLSAEQQPALVEFYQPRQQAELDLAAANDAEAQNSQLVTDEMRRAADEAFMGKGHVSQGVSHMNGDKRLVRFKARDRRSPDRLPNGEPVGQTVVRLDSHQQPRPKGSPILKRRSAPHERGWPIRR